MATSRQIAANRRNAQRSSGPRTPAGRHRAARNALTHGLNLRGDSGVSPADIAEAGVPAMLNSSTLALAATIIARERNHRRCRLAYDAALRLADQQGAFGSNVTEHKHPSANSCAPNNPTDPATDQSASSALALKLRAIERYESRAFTAFLTACRHYRAAMRIGDAQSL